MAIRENKPMTEPCKVCGVLPPPDSACACAGHTVTTTYTNVGDTPGTLDELRARGDLVVTVHRGETPLTLAEARELYAEGLLAPAWPEKD